MDDEQIDEMLDRYLRDVEPQNLTEFAAELERVQNEYMTDLAVLQAEQVQILLSYGYATQKLREQMAKMGAA